MNWFYGTVLFVARLILTILFGLKTVHRERVPGKGPVIVAANHQSYLDPPFLATALKREMHFFAKKELFDVPILGRLITRLNSIPVRRGVYDPAALHRVEKALAEGGGLIMFPEGTRGDGKEFLRPKRGVGMIARKSGATVVPAYLYRSNRLMGALFARRRVKVFFGDPIDPEVIARYDDNKEGYQELSEMVMERIARLRAEAKSS